MKIILLVFSLLCFLSFAKAQNTNITLNSDLSLNCKFEKVILKNPDHNFESFTKDQIKRKDINKLIIQSKIPDVLNVKNLSEFFNTIDLENATHYLKELVEEHEVYKDAVENGTPVFSFYNEDDDWED